MGAPKDPEAKAEWIARVRASNQKCWSSAEVRSAHSKKMKSVWASDKLARNEQSERMSGANHYNWKGGISVYATNHIRFRKAFPPPSCCEECNLPFPPKQLEAHNISREFRWDDRSDWKYVCNCCHRKICLRHSGGWYYSKERGAK